MAGEGAPAGTARAIDGITGRATVTARTTYLALLTAAPSDTTTLATMAEVTTAGYARQAVTWNAPSGDPSTSSNGSVITFGPFTADPPNVGWLALVSAATGTVGDFLYLWAADTPRDGAVGDTYRVAIGDLIISLD